LIQHQYLEPLFYLLAIRFHQHFSANELDWDRVFFHTRKSSGYTYLHSVGDIWLNKDPRVFRVMVGLLFEGQNKELSTTSTDLKKGFDMISEKTTNYVKSFSAILKQLLVIICSFPSNFFHNLHIMYICWFYWGYEFVC
jgi:hypothetical protein